ncbi:hypothetical protein F5Y03DRAFT_293295 [Xylaria venustula]|nr:hypothetical protein F5Y03DRAFT_293295 [Xylaria venustula]
MCFQYISRYPCGHTKSRWELCNKAKAANLLRFGRSETACDNSVKKSEAPDLQDSCGAMCLTRPYKCNKCDSQKKQLAWHCSDCGHLRDETVLMWYPCSCPKHRCSEAVLGTPFCKQCLDRCVPKGRMLKWLCHACGSLAHTFPTEMECPKCLHIRCGKCKSCS